MKPCDRPDGARIAGPWLYDADPNGEHPFSEVWTRDIGTGVPTRVLGSGREWWWSRIFLSDRRGHFASRAEAMRYADAWLVEQGYTLTGGVPGDHQVLPMSTIERKTTCAKCGASIVEYHPLTGMLPDEVDGDRHATHHWRACELHVALRAKGAVSRVGGFVVERSTDEFLRACGAELAAAEAASPSRPELVAVLRDAVRLARELEARDRARVALPFEPIVVPPHEKRILCAAVGDHFKGREIRIKADDLDKIFVESIRVAHQEQLSAYGAPGTPAPLLHGVTFNMDVALTNMELKVIVENRADVAQTVSIVMYGEPPTDDDYKRNRYR